MKSDGRSGGAEEWPGFIGFGVWGFGELLPAAGGSPGRYLTSRLMERGASTTVRIPILHLSRRGPCLCASIAAAVHAANLDKSLAVEPSDSLRAASPPPALSLSGREARGGTASGR